MDSNRVGARGFEPPTSCSQIERPGSPTVTIRLQTSDTIQTRDAADFQLVLGFTNGSNQFTTRLLPTSAPTAVGPDTEYHPPLVGDEGWKVAGGTPARTPTIPTISDLQALRGGPGALLTIAEVAQRLRVCNQTVYRLCQRGALVHVRIIDSIRVRPADLDAYIAAQSSMPGRRRR
jgi:excisionase family DNA binding protein